MFAQPRLLRIRNGLLLSFVLFALALPLAAAKAADPFVCCLCKSTAKKDNFCALTPTGTTCQTASQKINDQTGSKFNVTCQNLDMTGCKKMGTDSSAQCPAEPQTTDKFSAAYFGAMSSSTSNNYTTGVALTLNVPIPGVTFSDKLAVSNNMIQVPYLAIYISTFQKYLMGISLVVAALMLVYGGIRYIWGGTGASIESAKSMIQDALIGLMIVLFAVVLLSNINPNTTVMGPLQVPVVKYQGTPEDIFSARKMVEDAARIPVSNNASWMNYVTGQSSGNTKTKGEGTIARNAAGQPVAQGSCPPDMVAIKQSDTYKPLGAKTVTVVPSFCIDRFEAPNIPGVKPYNGALSIEAAWWCDQRDKRLCNIDEWQRACSGPDGKKTYGYSDKFQQGLGRFNGYPATKNKAPCNYDTYAPSNVLSLMAKRDKILGAFDRFYPSQADGSILTPASQNTSLQNEAYRTAYTDAMAFIKGVSLAEPSGGRPTCVTEEGVFDMVGNVQEIALGRSAAKKTIEDLENYDGSFIPAGDDRPYAWMSFYWSPVAHKGENNSAVGTLPSCFRVFGGGHALSWRPYENGFRCCLDLNEAATGPNLTQPSGQPDITIEDVE